MGSILFRSRLQILYGTIALLFASLVFMENFNQYSMHVDEVVQVKTSNAFNLLDFDTYTDQVFEIGHPPLYYVLLKIWRGLTGHDDYAMRTLSILAGLLTVSVIFRTGVDLTRQSFGGFAAATIFASMGFAVYYIHEVHNYACFLLLTASFFFLYHRWWNRSNSKVYGVAVVITTTLLLYVHYFGTYVIIGVNAYALNKALNHRAEYRRWFILQSLAVILYLPWLPAIIELSQTSTTLAHYNAPNTFSGLSHEVMMLVYQRPAIYGFVILVGLVGLWRQSADVRRQGLSILAFFAIFMIVSTLAAFIVDNWVESFYDRRIIFLLIALALLCAVLVSFLPRSIAWVILVATVVLSLQTPKPPELHGNWFIRQTVQFVDERAQPYDFVFYPIQRVEITDYHWLNKPFLYYSGEIFEDSIDYRLTRPALDTHEQQVAFANEVFADWVWTRERFWVVQTAPDNPLPEPTTTDWVALIDGRHFELTERYEVPLFIVSLFTATPDEVPIEYGQLELGSAGEFPYIFGDSIELTDYRIDQLQAFPGGSVSFWSTWQALQPIAKNYAIGLYLLGDDSTIYAQLDSAPNHLRRTTPTRTWIPNRDVYSKHSVMIPVDTPPGVYAFVLALYSRDDLSRLSIDPVGQDHLVLAMVEVRTRPGNDEE